MALKIVDDGEQMRDWPAGLKLNATACELGKAIYYARAEAFGLAVKAWEALEPYERHTYVGHGRDMLETVRPVDRRNSRWFDLAADLARSDARKVIGAITPDVPESFPLDPRD